MIAKRIEVKGRVQGVGFRPFIYRIATFHSLNGWVLNSNEGVTIKVQGPRESVSRFIETLRDENPPATSIRTVKVVNDEMESLTGFTIRPSLNVSDMITEISPDIAVCDECLADMAAQPHRIDYPLINCTNCGPRFSIIRDLPYDRANTTMNEFPMCPVCSGEYHDIRDRRFHAQPVACNTCGPGYEWQGGRPHPPRTFREILEAAVKTIGEGKILAVKGIGGFHLACDAFRQEAVVELRKRKGREKKPLAVMFRDIETAGTYTWISVSEKKLLTSWRRPIVLLKLRQDVEQAPAPAIHEGLSTLGVILPYMPFHYQLMERLETPAIVLTSGNVSEDPVIISDEKAVTVFRDIADAVITHQRGIHNRLDDSVIRLMAGRGRMIRRSRGYCPDPIKMGVNVDGIFASGAELLNCFCLGKESDALLSQHIGDLKTPDTYSFYTEAAERYFRLFRFQPACIATDLHPDYLSTRFALKLAGKIKGATNGIPVFRIQHHHAHIVSCMTEHGLDETVIGVAFDGTGLGTDGHIWGSEFFIADREDFTRYAHFEYLPMPGGDKAAREPWRMALSALHHSFGNDLREADIPFRGMIAEEKTEGVMRMIRQQINTPLTCGAGRYFDALAALLGLCLKAGYEGECPMKLESMIRAGIRDSYLPQTGQQISFIPVFREIVSDIRKGTDPAIISTKFHNSFIIAIFDTITTIRKLYGLNKVVFSGGVFQNKYLVDNLHKILTKSKFKVYLQTAVPPNDGGISLGQLAVAAKRRNALCA